MEPNILVGAHMSISGGTHKSIARGEAIGCTAIQIFNKSSRSWHAKALSQEEINLFKSTQKASSIKIVISHTSYLINICSPNAQTEKKSVAALHVELDRCEQLGIPYLVLHPGSHVKSGEEVGIEKIAKNLDLILGKSKGITKILLETMAGQGTNIGHTFEQLKAIRSKCKQKRKIGICLDTCHIFAAGYNINTEKGYQGVMKQFDKILGINLIKAIHVNDSKTECGAHKDRHENLGKGKIARQAFKMIMNDKRFAKVPKILETPVQDEQEYAAEIKMLKRMVKN